MSPASSAGEVVALDTSAAVPLLLRTHPAHDAKVRWARGRRLVVAGHAAVETYSVLTRLPGDVRVEARDAARLVAGVGPTVVLDEATSAAVPERLAAAGIAGGAAYDALVALAAVAAGAVLGTRDARATATYQALGATVVVVG